MQLNEIIEENTLASISNRTRLSYENLEKLFERDFSGFRKVQALGFISILEREYRADLSQLRAECLAYFEGDPSVSEMHVPVVEAHRHPPHKPSSVLDASMERKTHSMLKPILIMLVGAMLLYAAWWTYTSSKEGDATMSASGEKVGFFTSILQQAQSWIGGTSDNEIPEANAASNESSTGVADQSDDSFVITEASKKPKNSANETPTEDDKQVADSANNASTDDGKEQTVESADNTPDESEKQTSSDNAAVIQEVTPSTDDSIAPTETDEAIKKIGDALAAATDTANDASAPLAAEVPSVANDTQGDAEGRSIIKEATERALKDAREAKAKQEAAARKQAEEEAARVKAEEEARRIAAEEKARQEQAARERAAQQKAAREKAAKAGVVLQPTSKVWLGIVDLLTMKRSTAVTKNKMTFKNPKGKWIIATGHGRIRFILGDKEIKLNDGKKHFLLIQKGSVKEIPHETFQKLNKSKVW